ncbi:MAG: hypothetical protein ACON4J_01340 [Parvibaculales bacterium]
MRIRNLFLTLTCLSLPVVAMAAPSSVTAVACTSTTVTLTINDNDDVSASGFNVNLVTLLDSDGSDAIVLTDSTVTDLTGNNLRIDLSSSDQTAVSSIISDCKIDILADAHANLNAYSN